MARHEDIKSFDALMEATEDGRGKIYDKLAARLLQVLIDMEQQRACMPKPTRP